MFKPNVEKLKEKREVVGLIKALEYKEDPYVRKEAAEALGEIGDKRAVDPLIKALKDKDVCEYATRALEEIVEWYTGAFCATECDCNNSWCEEIVTLLGKIGEPAVEPVIKVFEHRYEGSLMYANKALKEIGEPAIEPLIKALGDKDRDAWIRMESARILGEIKEERAVEPLIQALEDENGWVRENAAEALDSIYAWRWQCHRSDWR